MMNNVEMIYEYRENPYDFTFSYIANDGTRYVYCFACKKFEKMGALVSFDESDRSNYSFAFEYYKNDNVDTHKVYSRRLRYYSYERLIEAYAHENRNYYSKSKCQKGHSLFKEICYFICPECGTKYSRKHVLYFETRQPRDMVYRYGVQLFKEPSKNGMLVKLVTLNIEYGVWHDRLIIKRYRDKITFNTDTGYTYQLKKKYFTVNRTPKGAPMKNISYSKDTSLCYLLHSEKVEYEIAYQLLYNTLFEEKQRILGHKPDGYNKEPNANVLAGKHINYLCFLNRFPNVPFEVTSRIVTEVQDYYCVPNKKARKVTMKEDDWAKTLAEAYGLESSKFIKRLIRSGHHPQEIKVIQGSFKQPNNITRLLNSSYRDMTKDIFQSEFIQDTIKLCGETGAVNKLLNESRNVYYLRDTVNMYRRAKEVLGKYDIRGTIMQTHDKLSLDYRKLQNANITIKHEEKAYALERSTDKFDLVFAKDTHELIDIGSAMRICVGSYGDSAIAKRCNIMVVRNKQKQPLVCIELSGDYTSIRQAKYFGNSRLPKEEYDFVMQWAKDHKLKADIYDLEAHAQTPKVTNEFNVYVPAVPMVRFAN